MKINIKKITTYLLIVVSLITLFGCFSVSYADSNSIRSAFPNDMGYVSGEQWAINKISLPSAWEIEKGNQLLVGIIDSGIDATHPDLQGRIDTTLSKSFVEGYNPLEDATGHGTHVAGIIAAKTNNSIGIAGVCWNVKLVSLRVIGTDSDEFGTDSIIEAFDYAQTKGIKLLNFSIGASHNLVDYGEVEDAIESYPGLVICAAGYSSGEMGPSDKFPKPWINHAPNAIMVGASTESDRIMDGSGKGYLVDIFAPGKDILSCYPVEMCENGTHDTVNTTHHSNGYHYKTGTSMAAPYVTGVAALIMSENPALPVSTVKQIILRTADTVYDENGNDVFGDWCVSGGRLNAGAALQMSHMHDLDEGVSDCEHEWHTVVCETCGACDIEQPHEFIATHGTDFPGHIVHYGVCSCGYEIWGDVYCVYDLYVAVSHEGIEMHRIYCACGQYKESCHVVVPYEDLYYSWKCLYCDKKYEEEHTSSWQEDVDLILETNTSFPVVHVVDEGDPNDGADDEILWVLNETGSFWHYNGAIYLSPEDAALVEAGSLNPYSLINDIIYEMTESNE